jgi:hypothetical protein
MTSRGKLPGFPRFSLPAFVRSPHKQIQPSHSALLALAFYFPFRVFYIPIGNLLMLGTRFISDLHFPD